MNDVAISIIVPVYNVEKYLQECVDSILSQSFKNYEIILVEDCSTDNSKALCRKIRYKNSKVKLIYNIENKGLSISRNKGIDIAEGKYITFIDSDDWVGKDYLKSMYDVAESQNADVVSMGYTDYITYDGENYNFGNIIQPAPNGMELSVDKKQRLLMMTDYLLCANACGKLYKKSIFIENNLKFRDITSEDILIHIPILYLAEKYILIPDVTYYYRKGHNSTTNGSSIKKSKKALEAIVKGSRYLDEYIEEMPEIRSDELLVACIRIFFADTLFKFLFLKVSKGLEASDIMQNAVEVFNKEAPKQAGLLTVLLEQYLKRFLGGIA